MKEHEKFDEALKRALREANTSIRSIAREAGVPNPSVFKFLHNQYDITCRVASNLASVVMPEWNANVKMLNGSDETSEYLNRIVRETKDDLKVIGNEATYCKDLEHAVAGGVNYQRILIGEFIPGCLDGHLRRVAKSPCCDVYQTTAMQYQPMVIGDESALLLLQGANGIFGGLHLSSNEFHKNFSGYFQSVLDDNRTVNITDHYRSGTTYLC